MSGARAGGETKAIMSQLGSAAGADQKGLQATTSIEDLSAKVWEKSTSEPYDLSALFALAGAVTNAEEESKSAVQESKPAAVASKKTPAELEDLAQRIFKSCLKDVEKTFVKAQPKPVVIDVNNSDFLLYKADVKYSAQQQWFKNQGDNAVDFSNFESFCYAYSLRPAYAIEIEKENLTLDDRYKLETLLAEIQEEYFPNLGARSNLAPQLAENVDFKKVLLVNESLVNTLIDTVKKINSSDMVPFAFIMRLAEIAKLARCDFSDMTIREKSRRLQLGKFEELNEKIVISAVYFLEEMSAYFNNEILPISDALIRDYGNETFSQLKNIFMEAKKSITKAIEKQPTFKAVINDGSVLEEEPVQYKGMSLGR